MRRANNRLDIVSSVWTLERNHNDVSLRIKEGCDCRRPDCVPSLNGEQARCIRCRQFAQALSRVLLEIKRSDWSDGTCDWVWLRLSLRSRKRAERSKLAGGIEDLERVDRRVDLVCGVVAKVGGRAGWSASEAILD